MKYSVVIAEDEELLLNNLVKKVENSDTGFEVIGTAQTGIQAYELIQKLTPDLVITDIRMPVLDGISLIKDTKEHFPLTEFIIVSGFSDFEYTKKAIHFQVLEYLLKPIDSDELNITLSKLENKYKIQQNAFLDIFNPSTGFHTPAQISELLKDYICKNYCEDINLNLIANNINYSSSYLSKIFFKQYNCTPVKFLISLRIQKAQQLLTRNPELSIRQIGEYIGYPEQAYFSRIFKKQVGLSPLEYRETYQTSQISF